MECAFRDWLEERLGVVAVAVRTLLIALGGRIVRVRVRLDIGARKLDESVERHKDGEWLVVLLNQNAFASVVDQFGRDGPKLGNRRVLGNAGDDAKHGVFFCWLHIMGQGLTRESGIDSVEAEGIEPPTSSLQTKRSTV